jgi:hypothetical protein
MTHPIRNVLTKVTELFLQNVSPPWFLKIQQLFIAEINQTERRQSPLLSFEYDSLIWLQNHQKTVF